MVKENTIRHRVLTRDLMVMEYVQDRIRRFQTSKNKPQTTRQLAWLHAQIGKTPGEIPMAWEVLFNGCPEELLSDNGEPTCAEWAVSTALSMYAMHQKGKDPVTNSVDREGVTLGIAARRLAPSEDDPNFESVRRRFNALATSTGIEELAFHLRGLVSLLKREGIPLDYVALARDLYLYQMDDAQNRVRLGWGQDFYHRPKNSAEQEPDGEPEAE